MSTATHYVQVTGWFCVALLLLLLLRAVFGGTLKVYPFFYVYVAHISLTTILGLSIKFVDDDAYRVYYWATEAITTVLGVGVTWEIHRRILAHYPGVRRLAAMLLSLIFATVLVLSTAGQSQMRFSPIAVERDLRTVQALVLLTLFALVAYYSIRLGTNVRGIAIGYVFGIATAVLNLTLRFHFGKSFDPVWASVKPIEYLAALGIWCVTLWSYKPNPTPTNADIERDYERVAGQAVHAMVRLRAHLIHPDGS